MAHEVKAYRDSRGNLHLSPSAAVVADIASALGRVGDEGGLSVGVAKLVLEKRAEIEQAFADFDALQGDSENILIVSDHPKMRPSLAS